MIQATGWPLEYVNALPWPVVLESSRAFADSPPTHVLVRDFVGYKGPSFMAGMEAAEKKFLEKRGIKYYGERRGPIRVKRPIPLRKRA